MKITEENIKEALKKVIEPDLKKDIITLDLVSDIKVDGNTISFTVKVYNPAMHAKKRMEEALQFALERAFGKDVNAQIALIPLPKDKEPEVRVVKEALANQPLLQTWRPALQNWVIKWGWLMQIFTDHQCQPCLTW